MRFNLHSTVSLSVCSAILIVATPSVVSAGTVVEKIATTEVVTAGVIFGTVPYSYVDADSNLVGYSIDILDLIEAQIEEELGKDILLQVVETSPAERIPMLISGQIDIACDTRFTWERDRYVDFSLSYGLSGIRLLTLADSSLGTPESLIDQEVAIYPNSVSEDVMELVQPDASLVYVTSVEDAFSALESGEVDAIAGDTVVLAGLAAQRGSGSYRIAPGTPFDRYGIACMVPENNSAFLNMINYSIAGLAQGYVSEEPQSVTLIDQWFGEDGIVPLPRALTKTFFESVLLQRAQVPSSQ